jgi:hypothetical protein
MTTFGEVSWNDDVFMGENKKQTNSKDLFLRLKEGSNEMRIITQPFQYLVHKYKKEGDPGFGQKVSCSMIHGSCPLCAAGDKAKPRWLLGVISRDGGKYQILDISFAVFGQIRKYARNTARWGDPTKYDIDVVVDKNGSPTTYYTVQAIPKEALSAADQNIRDTQVDLDDLKRRVTPPQPDVVQKRMDKINGIVSADAPANGKNVTAKTAPKAATAPAVSMSDDEELEKSFPSYDETASS